VEEKMSKHHKQAESFEKWAKSHFENVHSMTAQTGTVYVTIENDGHEYKVRFADHPECYCSEDISVDPDGSNLEQAKDATVAFFADPTPREKERIQEYRAAQKEDIEARKREKQIRRRERESILRNLQAEENGEDILLADKMEAEDVERFKTAKDSRSRSDIAFDVAKKIGEPTGMVLRALRICADNHIAERIDGADIERFAACQKINLRSQIAFDVAKKIGEPTNTVLRVLCAVAHDQTQSTGR
jgi:hypothetical protein